MIEPGSEWFHREKRTLVTFVGSGFSNVAIKGEVGPPFDIPTAELHRDYARNVPVTRELLERMGWEMTEYGGGLSRGLLMLRENVDIRIYFQSGNPKGCVVVAGGDGAEEIDMPFPPTLRDLLNVLNVLKVFGVSAKVPEVVG